MQKKQEDNIKKSILMVYYIVSQDPILKAGMIYRLNLADNRLPASRMQKKNNKKTGALATRIICTVQESAKKNVCENSHHAPRWFVVFF